MTMEWMEPILSRAEGLGIWALPLETAVKSLLLMGLTFATVRLLAGRSAALRQTLWSAALVGLLALPILTLAGPQWPVTVVEKVVPAAAPVSLQESLPVLDQTEAPAGSTVGRADAGTWLLAVYTAGVTIVLIRWLAGVVALRRRLRTCRPVRDLAWRRDLCSLGRKLGVRQSVRIFQSDRVQAPLTWGVLSPAILVPAEALRWPAAVRRMVLLHELIHVRRRDLLVENLTQFACALYWFNPLVWLAAGQQRLEREKACDDAVLSFGTRPSDYARQLLYMAVRTQSERLSVGVSMAGRRQLEGRLVAILDPARRRRTALSTLLGASLTAAAVVVPLAAFSPVMELIPAPAAEGAVAPQRHTVDDLKIDMESVAIVNGELQLEEGGWFRVEVAGPPSQVVELRRSGTESRTYLVEGQEVTWNSEADELLLRGIEAGRALQRAREEMGRAAEQLERAREEAKLQMEDAHARMADSRHELEQHRLEMEQQALELHRRMEEQAHEMQQARHEMLRQQEAARHTLESDLRRASEERRIQMMELRQVLEELKARLGRASGEQRAEIERQLADRREQMAEQEQLLSELRQRQAAEVERHTHELQERMRDIEREQAERMAEARQELARSREMMAQQLAEARERMVEAERHLAEAHVRLEERRAEVSEVLRNLLFQTVEEMGLSLDQRDTELVAVTAARLSRAGSLRVEDDSWTFEVDDDVLRDVATSLASRLGGLSASQRDALSDRIVERLALVTGN